MAINIASMQKRNIESLSNFNLDREIDIWGQLLALHNQIDGEVTETQIQIDRHLSELITMRESRERN